MRVAMRLYQKRAELRRARAAGCLAACKTLAKDISMEQATPAAPEWNSCYSCRRPPLRACTHIWRHSCGGRRPPSRGAASPARFFVRSAPVGESATARNATSRGVSDRSPSTRVDAAATRAASIGLSAVLLLAVILVRRTRCSLIVVRQRV